MKKKKAILEEKIIQVYKIKKLILMINLYIIKIKNLNPQKICQY